MIPERSISFEQTSFILEMPAVGGKTNMDCHGPKRVGGASCFGK